MEERDTTVVSVAVASSAEPHVLCVKQRRVQTIER